MKQNMFLINIPCDKLSRDPDHTVKSRNFYAKFWKDTLSDCVSDYDGAVGHYRGETIISFNTIAGCMIRLLPNVYIESFKMPATQIKRLNIIINSKDKKVTECIKKDFQKFYEIYHSLANFMPLIRGSVHMNLVKGRSPYNDFPDLFLKDLNKRKPDNIFSDKVNVEYFSKFKNWKEFIELNYLQDFYMNDSYSEYVQLAPPCNIKMPYSKVTLLNMSDDDKAMCVNYIELFLNHAINIIEKRAKRLADQ